VAWRQSELPGIQFSKAFNTNLTNYAVEREKQVQTNSWKYENTQPPENIGTGEHLPKTRETAGPPANEGKPLSLLFQARNLPA
jgi:hypothetical protein